MQYVKRKRRSLIDFDQRKRLSN